MAVGLVLGAPATYLGAAVTQNVRIAGHQLQLLREEHEGADPALKA